MTERRRLLTPKAAAALLLLAAVMLTSGYPVRRFVQVSDTIESLRREERALDATAARLRRERALLRTDAEVERIARERLGMVRPGETAFVITPSVAPSAAAAPTAPPSEVRGVAARIKAWWRGLTRAAASLF